MQKEIFRNEDGKIVGHLTDRTYFRSVDSRKHKMRVYNAYGIDLKIMEDLKGKCDKVCVHETDTGSNYETDYENFISKGIEANYGSRQIFLPLKHWTFEDGRTLKLF